MPRGRGPEPAAGRRRGNGPLAAGSGPRGGGIPGRRVRAGAVSRSVPDLASGGRSPLVDHLALVRSTPIGLAILHRGIHVALGRTARLKPTATGHAGRDCGTDQDEREMARPEPPSATTRGRLWPGGNGQCRRRQLAVLLVREVAVILHVFPQNSVARCLTCDLACLLGPRRAGVKHASKTTRTSPRQCHRAAQQIVRRFPSGQTQNAGTVRQCRRPARDRPRRSGARPRSRAGSGAGPPARRCLRPARRRAG